MKAQMVKNAVIVPVGAKGGFVVKQPLPVDRVTLASEVSACYETFIRGLLDVTDNVEDARVIGPTAVNRYDKDDPYLVVAADKGTAAFSDHANAIAAEKRFWLGDAFASGGSAGYDHKAMGITARGAWVTCRVTSSATACCSHARSSWSAHSIIGTCFSIRHPTPKRATANASGCSACLAHHGPTTTPG